MSRILIIDNCEKDRLLTAQVLRDEGEYGIDFANDVDEALSRIGVQCPDIVLTDLFQLQCDGLRLVSQLREEHPVVPVILMTARGDGEIAVRALHCGAASNFPKRLLQQHLAHSVRRLIDFSRDQRNRIRLPGSMKQSQSTFILKNDLELIPTLIQYFQESMSQMGLGNASDRNRVCVAVEEALSNAIHHGNLEVESRLRQDDVNAYYRSIRQRQHEAPYCNREVEVLVRISNEEATFTIRDEGPGFDINVLPDPTNDERLEKVGGRGIWLMRSFMDEVTYNDSGNVVTMTKRRNARSNNH